MRAGVRRWIARGVLAGAVVALAVLGWRVRDRFLPVEPGRPAPDFALPTLAGDTLALSELRGRAVLLNLWATWCAPCRFEMPAMQRAYDELRDEGLEVVAVSLDAPPPGGPAEPVRDAVASFVDELGLTFPVVLDPEGTVQRRYGAVGLPTTFLIGRDGRVRQRILGSVAWDDSVRVALLRSLLED